MLEEPSDVDLTLKLLLAIEKERGRQGHGRLEFGVACSRQDLQTIAGLLPHSLNRDQLISCVEPPKVVRDFGDNPALDDRRGARGAAVGVLGGGLRGLRVHPRRAFDFSGLLAFQRVLLPIREPQRHSAVDGPRSQLCQLLLAEAKRRQRVDLRGDSDVGHAFGKEVLVLVLVMHICWQTRHLIGVQHSADALQCRVQLGFERR
mmetsp:Transcript_11567/g.29166  ORF Transcript_11567/g.29166 Transcript_11567/m.29166 type:complete len:204 (-) Transcript_11567:65-676(-)